MRQAPRFLPAGESAVVIELGDAIDPEVNARVLALDRALLEHPFGGYVEAIPTYRSLLVLFEPGSADLDTIRRHVAGLSEGTRASLAKAPLQEVPIVYDGEDLDEVARLAGLDREEVIRLHSEREYRVYMLGFTPGFAYMGTTDEKLALGRRATPRTRVPAGAVAIAMGQTAVYPSATPGGWHLLGRAEYRDLFDPGREPPSRFAPGDRVRFVPVDELPRREAPPASEAGTAPAEPVLEVEDGGLLTTVQDLGRVGYQRFGVPVAGAVDAPALRAANALVGNPAGAAALECTVEGPKLRCLRRIVVSLTGADLGAVVERSDLGRWRVPPWSSFLMRPGNVLRFEGRRGGARAYVGLGGGVDVPEVLGSRATYLTAGLGGLDGRPLHRGDLLAAGVAHLGAPGLRWRGGPVASGALRIVPGPQSELFEDGALVRLTSCEYVVGNASDRMGYRLDGPRLAHRGPGEIVSDGMMLGAIQVPPSGFPIVMMADRATTGGYPKIATVIGPDVARLGQRLPGDVVRFETVDLPEAVRLHEQADVAERRADRLG